MEGSRPFLRVIRRIKMLSRLPIDTHYNNIRGCFSRSPQFEQQAQSRIFFDVVGKMKKTCHHPEDSQEKAQKAGFK